MDLGIDKVVKEGNGNTLIYTALMAAAIANTLPTPFDAIYFSRVNKLQRQYDEKKITAEHLEWHVAGEYYIWTSLWYVALFTGIYAFGGKYRNNARVLLAVVAGGLVIGAVNKNIEVDKQIEKTKGNLPFTGSNDAKNVQKEREIVKKSQNQSFTGFNEQTYWNDAFNQWNSYYPTDKAKK